jgi:cation transport ATPase
MRYLQTAVEHNVTPTTIMQHPEEGNMEIDKANYLISQFQKNNEEKRLGSVEIVKVILSIVSVLLTVLATLETINPQPLSFCEDQVRFLLKFAPYFFLFLCSGFCLYHLNYSLNTHHSNMTGLVSEALEKSKDFDSAYTYLQSNSTFPLPYIYKKALTIIFTLFTLGLISTVLRIV